MEDRQVDNDLIDETVLALMFLTLHGSKFEWRAWKGFAWDSLARLHAKNLILDPVGTAKSVVLTEEGRKQCEEAHYRLFSRKPCVENAADN